MDRVTAGQIQCWYITQCLQCPNEIKVNAYGANGIRDIKQQMKKDGWVQIFAGWICPDCECQHEDTNHE